MAADTSFGERLTGILEKKGITQKEFALSCDINQGTLSRYMTGAREPKGSIIAKMAGVLDINPDYLIGGIRTSMGGETPIDFGKLYSIVLEVQDKLSIRQKTEIMDALFKSERESGKNPEDDEVKELFNDTLSNLIIEAKDPDFYHFALSDINRSLSDLKTRMKVHILSQGIFKDQSFIFSETTFPPVSDNYFHSYKVVTSPPYDYFLCSQDPEVWKEDEDAYVTGNPEYILMDINPDLRKHLPKKAYATGRRAVIEESEDSKVSLIPSPDSTVHIPVNDKELTLPLFGTSMFGDELLDDIDISILKQPESLILYIKMLEMRKDGC